MTSFLHRPGTMPTAQPAENNAARRRGASLPTGATRQATKTWELVSPLGEGRWAKVYSARIAGAAGVDYAIKVPKSHHETDAQNAQSVAMLKREALIGSSFSHPHLVPVLDWQLRDEPFLVMPRLEGATLRTLLLHRRRKHGCLIGGTKFLPHSVWVVRQVAAALAALHGSGWLHGDVKPENVLVSPQGHATLIDLGLARKLGSRECQWGEVLSGTLCYVSPESFLPAATLRGESDIYSLGTMLYELLTGQPLFNELDPARMALLHLRAVPADVRDAALDVPPAAARLVMEMLAKEPLRRPPAEEVVRRLTRLEIELMAAL
jgi:serine/threonine protein kinase